MQRTFHIPRSHLGHGTEFNFNNAIYRGQESRVSITVYGFCLNMEHMLTHHASIIDNHWYLTMIGHVFTLSICLHGSYKLYNASASTVSEAENSTGVSRLRTMAMLPAHTVE